MKTKITALLSGLLLTNIVSAATVINLQDQSANFLKQHMAIASSKSTYDGVIATNTFVDENQTAHTRIQQTYAGLKVWNATGVTHTAKALLTKNANALDSLNANTTMNGKFYAGLEKDLSSARTPMLTDSKKDQALKQAKSLYQQQTHHITTISTKESVDAIVYVDDNNQAHYAYLVSFYLDDHVAGAHRPVIILDADSLQLYKMWDRVKTDEMPLTLAGGVGGNKKTGPYIYDGGNGNHLAALTVSTQQVQMENGKTATVCWLAKDDILVEDVSYQSVAGDLCFKQPSSHHGVAWISNDNNGTRWSFDEMNGAYSPSLDAYANGMIIEKMYQDWYGIPVLTNQDGTPMQLLMRTHYGRSFDNAFWDGESMTFGDGGNLFYPLTSLDVAAHEISHGFTEQHSDLDASSLQMGGLHESFSDMAAVAAQYYQTGQINWKLGNKITKTWDALRYIDAPTKDGRSIDNYKNINKVDDPHLAGGITNKAFYLLATTDGWDIHRAFDVMVRANMVYWTSSMKTLPEAACGVVKATQDKGYNVDDVHAAFQKVGIDTSADACKKLGM